MTAPGADDDVGADDVGTDGVGADGGAAGEATTDLYDLRVVVDRIEGRSVCGMRVGDYLEVTRSNEVRIPEGRHFCMYALASVLPLLPAKQRELLAGDWMAQDSHVACPDPDERLIMRVERLGRTSIPTEELT